MIIEEPDNLCLGCMAINDCINDTSSVCPYCGFDNNTQQESTQALPLRTILHDKFLIGRVLGKGGFGITYLAWDLVLQTPVAIKEYMPFSLVGREPGRTTVIAHTSENKTAFEYGLKQFLLEARTLAQFSHANVVRVREFFPANNTAYLVMDYYKGMSLHKFLQQRNTKLSEQEALKIILPILDGLAQVHKKGFLHRDIKPDNIYLNNYEHPVLLDFGAARSAFGQKSQSLSVILTPGFAPFEQYLSRSTFTASTDIYAVAATLYYMVSGVKPHEATARLKNDPMLNLANLEPSLTQEFSKAIMQGLALFPEQRPQTVEEFQQRLVVKKPEPEPSAINPPVSKPESETVAEHKKQPLTLTPIGQSPASQKTRKRDTYTCPHCQTKNIIPEGKRFSEAICTKCRKTPFAKDQPPPRTLTAATVFKIGLIVVLVLLGFSVITKKILGAGPITARPGLSATSAGPASEALPSPHDSAAMDAGDADKPSSANSSNRQNERQDREEAPAPQAPSSASPAPLPKEDPRPARLPPQFALDACVGKKAHDSCVAHTPRRPLPGVCENVRDMLACIPDGDGPR